MKFGLVILSVFLTQPVLANSSLSAGKPFDDLQILSLICAGYSTDRLVTLVTQRGINIEPTDETLKVLEGAGAEIALLKALRSARRFEPSTVDATLVAKHVQTRQHLARGLEFSKQKLLQEAEKEYRAALETDPNNAFLHFPLGRVLLDQHNLNDAMAEARAAVDLLPDEPLAQNSLVSALILKADWKGAEAALRTSIDLSPDDYGPHLSLCSIWLAQGSPDLAVSECEDAIRLRPDSAEAHMLLGTALSQISDHTLRKSEYEKAVVEYRAAVGLRPDWAAPHSALANLFWSRGNMKPAREEAREAYRLDPTNPGCRMTADRLEWGQGIESHWNEATAQNTQQSYEKFIKKYPQSNLAVEAKQRNSNPDYAFLVTCHLRSEKAVQG